MHLMSFSSNGDGIYLRKSAKLSTAMKKTERASGLYHLLAATHSADLRQWQLRDSAEPSPYDSIRHEQCILSPVCICNVVIAVAPVLAS